METVSFKRPDGKTLNIEIIKYTNEGEMRGYGTGLHRHDFHSILYVQGGETVQEVDFLEYKLRANQLLVIPKGCIHCEKTIQGIQGYVVLFKDDFFSNIQKELLNGLLHYVMSTENFMLEIDLQNQAMLQNYFELLFYEQAESDNHNQTFILQNLMLALLNRLENIVGGEMGNQSFIGYRSVYQKFINNLEENYVKEKSVRFYAQSLHLTTRQLNVVLKKILGKTAQDIIIDHLMLQARRLLCFETKSIKEIAADLGYDNPFYFSRLFKKRLEMSPEEFRSRFAQ